MRRLPSPQSQGGVFICGKPIGGSDLIGDTGDNASSVSRSQPSRFAVHWQGLQWRREPGKMPRRSQAITGHVALGGCKRRRWQRISSLLVLAFLVLLANTVGQASKIDEEPEIALEQIKQEAVLEVRYAHLKNKYGLRDTRTLEVFFELFDLWIMLYRLNKADAALAEVVPACEWRQDDFSIKAVQALAFTRWKQGRHREALARFHEMEGWLGKNPALSENIGHTYNTLGEYAEAERYFLEALKLTQMSNKKESNAGGILLGLSGVQERRGLFDEALSTAAAAYEFYKERDSERGWESSLTAKAAGQFSKVLMKLGEFRKAEKLSREAVRLFELTAGDDSPLVAGALERLGTILAKLDKRDEAIRSFQRAYELEARKDAFDLVAILEIHNKLIGVHTSGGGLDRLAFRLHFPVAGRVVARVRAEMKQDGNAGAYYKAAGEIFVLGDDCEAGEALLLEAIELFRHETSIDTSGLIKECADLVAYCDGTLTVARSGARSGTGDGVQAGEHTVAATGVASRGDEL